MLDFDHAILDFWDWFEAKQEEQVVGSDSGRKPGRGQTWIRKYRSYQDIFALYGSDRDTVHDDLYVDPEVQAVDIEALLSEDDDDEG